MKLSEKLNELKYKLNELKYKDLILAGIVVILLFVLFIIFKYETKDEEDASNTEIALTVFVIAFLTYVIFPIVYKGTPSK